MVQFWILYAPNTILASIFSFLLILRFLLSRLEALCKQQIPLPTQKIPFTVINLKLQASNSQTNIAQ